MAFAVDHQSAQRRATIAERSTSALENWGQEGWDYVLVDD